MNSFSKRFYLCESELGPLGSLVWCYMPWPAMLLDTAFDIMHRNLPILIYEGCIAAKFGIPSQNFECDGDKTFTCWEVLYGINYMLTGIATHETDCEAFKGFTLGFWAVAGFSVVALCMYIRYYMYKMYFRLARYIVKKTIWSLSFVLLRVVPAIVEWAEISWHVRSNIATVAESGETKSDFLDVEPAVVVVEGRVGRWARVGDKKFFLPSEGEKAASAAAEALIPGSPLEKLDVLPSCSALLVAPGTAKANCFRFGDALYTVSHVFKSESDIKAFSLQVGTKSLELKNFDIMVKQFGTLDFVKITFGKHTNTIFTQLGLRSLKRLRYAKLGSAVRVVAADPENGVTGLTSVGLPSVTKLPFHIAYDASTKVGMSGAPVLQDGCIVGIHLGRKEDKNLFLDLCFLDEERLKQADGPVAESENVKYQGATSLEDIRVNRQFFQGPVLRTEVDPINYGKKLKQSGTLSWADMADDYDWEEESESKEDPVVQVLTSEDKSVESALQDFQQGEPVPVKTGEPILLLRKEAAQTLKLGVMSPGQMEEERLKAKSLTLSDVPPPAILPAPSSETILPAAQAESKVLTKAKKKTEGTVKTQAPSKSASAPVVLAPTEKEFDLILKQLDALILADSSKTNRHLQSVVGELRSYKGASCLRRKEGASLQGPKTGQQPVKSSQA